MTRSGRTASSTPFRLAAIVLLYSLILSLCVFPGGDNARAFSSPPTQGAPAQGLPNLDALRQIQPVIPKMREVAPSTQCSPAQPDCNSGTGAKTTPPQPSLRRNRPSGQKLLPAALHKMEAWATHHLQRGTRALPLAQPQSGGTYDDFVMARLDPDNRIGGGGEDVLSRNFNWSLPLVGMPGRAGLNLGLALSYNSLVWTRAGSYITYDADKGFPTPGFRLGFPEIYGLHYNSQTGKYGYLVLMPSGARMELRQVGSTNIYEAADSSYLFLIDNGGTLLLRSTDGTQLTYTSTTNGYRCTQVRDRNGNYLTIAHNTQGRITSVTDTLGRVFNFNYDANQNLSTITQTRGTTPYTWASFSYTPLTIQTNFSNLSMVGLQNGTTLPVLSQVSLPDNTYYKFSYTSWGQVHKITHYAADSDPNYDNHALNYVSYNLPQNATTAETDCPRFTQRKVWAENWNNSAEAVTNYTAPSSVTQLPDGTQGSWTFCQIQTPDGVYYNSYSRSSGWDEGLTVLEDTWADDGQGLAFQRRTTTAYTQDDTGAAYRLNPRVTETNVYDPANNRRRTAVSYTSFMLSCGTGCTLSYYLPSETKEYAANATDILRTTQTDYNTSFDYTSRRIFGLVSQKRVYHTVASTSNLMSKVSYDYDDTSQGFLEQLPGTPVQHDTSNYGTSFVVGRGNLTKTTKWDVTSSASLVSKMGYNTTGSPTFTRDPLNHQQSISYADYFTDTSGTSTYAFPTVTTDADGNESLTKYSYHLGAVTYKQGPAANAASPSQATGAYVTSTYDSAGRLSQVTNSFNSATTTYIYPTSSNAVQTYTTIKDTQSPTVSSKLLDGAGRVRATASDHPGITGRYIGQIFIFDKMGRIIQTSNPTEINGGWGADGADAVAGWVYSSQTYDWKGRPRVTTNQDSSTKSLTYGGCGCAGGEIVTSTDELGRKQKVTHDALGRVIKTEAFKSNGVDVYRTTTNTYNALDQVTSTQVQDENLGTGQVTSLTYDGYGRLKTRHLPIYDTNAVVTYTYYNDDTVQRMTDARGATADYTYNARRLVTKIEYAPPPGTNIPDIPDAPTVDYTYDAVGNRKTMTDGMGSVSYQYDALSRMTSESRIFTNLGTTSYTMSYTYNLAGQLTSITNPWGVQVGYVRDITGSLMSVTGDGYANGADYVTAMTYRAWGALKNITYANGVQGLLSYTNRLQPSNYKLNSTSTLSPSPAMDIDYSYTADGRLKLSTDNKDAKRDRAYAYDHLGRMTAAFTGSEARAWVQSGGQSYGTVVDGPYRQSFTLDAWDNVVVKFGRSFTSPQQQQTVTRTYDSASGRILGWAYDADGRVSAGDTVSNIYDAAGRLRSTDAGPGFEYDGDGNKARQLMGHPYYLRSTVLGQTIAEIDPYDGTHMNGFIYANGELIATIGLGFIYWQHTDVSGKSIRTTDANQDEAGRDELDPMNVKVDGPGQHHHGGGSGGSSGHDPGGIQARVASLADIKTCDFYGMAVPCSMKDSFQEHVSSFDQMSMDRWEGMETWTTTATAYFNNGSKPKSHVIAQSRLALFSGFKPINQYFVIANLTTAEFTEEYAQNLVIGDSGMAQNANGGGKDDQPYKRALNKHQMSMLIMAVSVAGKALSSRSECAAYIRGGTSYNPIEVLGILLSEGRFFNGGTPGSVAETYGADVYRERVYEGGTVSRDIHNPIESGIVSRDINNPVGGSLPLRGTGPGAYIGLRNLFFNSTAGGWAGKNSLYGSGSLSPVQARALTLLHELRHALTGIYHPHTNPNRQSYYSEESNTWNKNIFEKCFK